MSDEDASTPQPLFASLARLALWLATAAVGILAISQAFGVTGIALVFALQALTPFVVVGAIVLILVALVVRMWTVVLLNALAVAGLVTVLMPVIGGSERPVVDPAAPQLVMAVSNIYYENPSIDAAATTLLDIDADVLGIIEYNPAAAAALEAQGVNDRYPYRSAMPRSDRTGIVLFSRLPIIDSIVAPIGHQLGIIATIDVRGVATRVILVHPVPASSQSDVGRWSDDLKTIGRTAADSDLPTVVAGDFNASRWHPAFRHMLDWGLDDVHEQLGKGWTRSWPANRSFPPFVRIDHALVRNGAAGVAMREIVVPGSDHRGFVVTIAVQAVAADPA